MRVIAGLAKGKKLKIPKTRKVRPTQDKIKGAIFNILGEKIIDSCVLDLFCGSGALGIEALSRGAKECTFVDKNTKLVRKNLDLTGFNSKNKGSNIRAIEQDVKRAIRILDREQKKFDIIFADPPYDSNLTRKLLSWLEESDILNSLCFIIIEHSKNEILDVEKVKERQYGNTIVSIIKL